MTTDKPLIDQLKEQAQIVARARQASSEATKTAKDSLLKWQTEHQDIADDAALKVATVTAEENRLRELTLAAFKADPTNKRPAPEVGIREVEKLEYNQAEAFSWAIAHNLALKLDITAFEKTVKAQPASFGFVHIEKVVTATIAQVIEVKVNEERK